MVPRRTLPRALVPVDGNLTLFDVRPMRLDGFVLRARAAVPVGRPSIKQWQAAFEFVSCTEESSPYWVGDLMTYAESREDWQEKLAQAMSVTGLAKHTIDNRTYVSRHVAESARHISPSITHSAEVAALPPAEQEKFLDQARTHGWTVRDLRLNIKAAKRARIIDGQAVLEGLYRVIYADPPWEYGNRPPSGKGAAEHYPGMSIADLCKLPVQAHALPDAVLAMWTTPPTLLQTPGPREVGEAWGFTYKQHFVWDKVDGNFSNYTGGNHEILTIWTRGSCLPDLGTDLPDSVQVFRKSRVHSEKPKEFRQLLMKHWTRGPYLELFGREPVEKWDVFGNDARLWTPVKASA